MRDLKNFAKGIVVMVAVFLCGSPVLAQTVDGEKPKPAAHDYSLLLDVAGNQQDGDTAGPSLQPDDRPLSGVQNPTVGTAEVRHSYWVPGIRYSNSLRSNGSNGAANTGWNSTSFVSTDVSLLQAWSHSTLSANYSGGGYFSTDKVQGNGQYQQLAATYEIDLRRWQVVFLDQFSYLPESSFGFGGLSGLSSPGIAGALAVPISGLQTGYVPGQTILTAVGPRYSNTGSAQVTYRTSLRGSITIGGTYGILRFVNAGNVNNDNEMFNAGYDYSVTARDHVGFAYRFGAYRYPGNPQALGDHAVQLEYGRKITGKLALRLAGGPEITTFRVPIGTSTDRISGSGNASLTYSLAANASGSLQYAHGVSGGSGVFAGATSDQIGITLGKRLTRVWNGSLNFGYARNRQILAASGAPSYDSWFAGAGLSRPLGRMADFSMGYQAQIQGSGGGGSNTNYTVQQIFFSVQWHSRPLILH